MHTIRIGCIFFRWNTVQLNISIGFTHIINRMFGRWFIVFMSVISGGGRRRQIQLFAKYFIDNILQSAIVVMFMMQKRFACDEINE